jgi:hypothetical protein
MITKFSSSAPSQRLPMSPAKNWSNKMRVGGYGDDGRCSSLKQGKAYENASTKTNVALADTGGHRNGKR